jgi:hypothetical protein
MQNCRSSPPQSGSADPEKILTEGNINESGTLHPWNKSCALSASEASSVTLLLCYYRYRMFVCNSISYYVSLSKRVSFSVEMYRYLINNHILILPRFKSWALPFYSTFNSRKVADFCPFWLLVLQKASFVIFENNFVTGVLHRFKICHSIVAKTGIHGRFVCQESMPS